jgi:flagellar biosynthetic protein FliQ
MTLDLPLMLMRQGTYTLLGVGGPLLGTLMVVGLVVGVLQATTQVNDPAVGFVPRILALMLVVWGLGGWMVERLAMMLRDMLTAMGGPP